MDHNRLRHFRITADLSVRELAKNAGVSIGLIYRIEEGRAIRVSQMTVAKLAKALDVDESDLFPLPEVRARRPAWAPASTTWNIIVTCPKCKGRFRYFVSEGVPEPIDRGVACPGCGFAQVISLRKGA